MVPNSIERDILIEAPVDVVWRTVTEPEQVGRWWKTRAVFELRAGAEGTLTWTDEANADGMTVAITIDTVEPPRRFAFRWVYGEGETPRDGNSLRVEFTLTPEGENTRLHLVESGLASMRWTDEEKAAYNQQHEEGWDRHLPSLRAHAVEQRGNAPAVGR